MAEAPDLRIALFGKTGSGKSSTGNTLLGRNAFGVKMSSQAVTRTCEIKSSVVGGRKITVIDSPGLFDPSMSERRLKDLMEKCANWSFPGLHAFLLVIRLDVELTEKEKNIVKWIKTNYGEDAARYTFILFTHADALNDEPLLDFIRESQHLQTLINSCGGRYHAFNNKERLNQDQVTMMIEKIDQMVQRNRAHHSTAEGFRLAQERIQMFDIGARVAVAAAAAALIAFLVMAKLEQH